MSKQKNRERGRKSRAAGARFELKVREVMEQKKWIVSKWMNTVSQEEGVFRLAKIKHKFLGPGKPMMLGAGFPDFVCFKKAEGNNVHYEVIGLEVKGNGYIDQKEKTMGRWLLENKIFSHILVAKRGKKRGEIEFVDFKERYE